MVFVKRILRYKNRTVLLSVGSLIPKDWNFVVIKVLEQNDKEMILKLTRVNSALEEALKGGLKNVENTK
jgi:hypothetical protein